MELSVGTLAPGAGVERLTVVIRDAASGKWRLFERPLEVVIARDVDAVLPALEKIENECARHQR